MVVVKAYIKMDPLEKLAPVEACLSKMAKALDTRSCPNVLPYQRWLQSNVSQVVLSQNWETKCGSTTDASCDTLCCMWTCSPSREPTKAVTALYERTLVDRSHKVTLIAHTTHELLK